MFEEGEFLKTDDLKFKSMAYIIDTDYKIVYYNDSVSAHFPSIKKGDYCYEVLCGENKPCNDCPVSTSQIRFHFNKKMGKWIEGRCADIVFPEVGECYIFHAEWIYDEGKVVRYFFGNGTEDGRLIELNLTKGTYNFLYNKGELSAKQSHEHSAPSLKEMPDFIRKTIIHPSDWEAHKEFWDIDTLEQRLEQSEHKGYLFSEFLEIGSDNNLFKAQEFFVQMPRNPDGDFIVRCFIKNKIEHSQAVDISIYDKQPIDTALTRLGINSLTGLRNKESFYHEASKLIAEGKPNEYCLAAIDLPQFWLYNKQFGRSEGDKILLVIAEIIKEAQNTYDTYAGYLGNDDFAIILPYDEDIVDEFFRKICDKVVLVSGGMQAAPKMGCYIIEDVDSSVISMYDMARNSFKYDFKNAENHVYWHQKEFQEQIDHGWHISRACLSALENGEFTFYLQPQYDLKNNKIVGAEALMRWKSSLYGDIPPAEFMPVLVDTGIVTQFDSYIWEQVFIWMSNKLKRGEKLVPVSLNVCRNDLLSINLPRRFNRLSNKYNVPKEYICIELTESILVGDYNLCRSVIQKLHDSGFKVYIDDFGSGHSSLGMVQNVSVDGLKLDRAFLIYNKDSEKLAKKIVDKILNLAEELSVSVVAEGVETQEHVEYLKSHDYNVVGQGFYFKRPVSTDEFVELLENE